MTRAEADGPWLDSCLHAGSGATAGLSDQEIFAVARFAANIDGNLLVEYNEDENNSTSVFLMPENARDSALMFSRDGGFLRLDLIEDDELEHISSAKVIMALFPAALGCLYARGWAVRSCSDKSLSSGNR